MPRCDDGRRSAAVDWRDADHEQWLEQLVAIAIALGEFKDGFEQPARVKVVVASVMQPTVEYCDQPNASL
jgi:hypothetical protein